MKTLLIQRAFSNTYNAGPILTRYGRKVLAAAGTIAAAGTLEGDWHPNRLMILEFESVEQAKRWYNSDEYAPVNDILLKAANIQEVLVQGL